MEMPPLDAWMRQAPARPTYPDPIHDRLLRDRILFLNGEVNDDSANLLVAQMLFLAAEDPDRDIALYINSPGGSIHSGMAIYDTMQYLPCDVSTVAVGLAASMAQFLLCAGAKGKRFATKYSYVMMHQPLGGVGGRASEVKIQAEHLLNLKNLMVERIAYHTGQSEERINEDSNRDRWFTAADALEYGMIDKVLETTRSVESPA